MEKDKKKIKNFTDLDAWREGHKLVLMIYDLTKGFPKEELFGLVMQLRRAIVSFTSNIAEGFSRTSYREKLQFYSMSLGSLTEVQNQLLIARDIGYLGKEIFDKVISQTVICNKLTNGLIRKSRAIAYTQN